MTLKPKTSTGYYFSPRLKNTFKKIFDYPLTVVLADSGCGKTTAVTEYFIRNLKPDTAYAIYTCFGEPIEKAWENFCCTLQKADPKRANFLKGLAKPTEDTIPEIAHQMSELQCNDPFVLVVDNYQLLDTAVHEKLINALSAHNCPHFYIVILTQPCCRYSCMGSSRILWISWEILAFNRNDIGAYFEKAGLPLDVEQAEVVWNTTEGLPAAVYLQLECYRNNGSFETSHSFCKLIESVFWNRLDQETRMFLTRMSVLQQFTIQQAEMIFAGRRLPRELTDLLQNSYFIRNLGSPKMYSFHALLRRFLLEQFEDLASAEKRKVWEKAGDACALLRDYANAALFYLLAGKLDYIGRLPFLPEHRVGLVRLKDGAIVKALISEPGCKTLIENPELALSLTLELFIQGEYRLHGQYFEWSRKTLFTLNKYGDERLRRLKGEFALMESFLAFNDVKRMCELHEKAYNLMGSVTQLYSLNDAWTFGAPSVVYMFWRDSGRLCEELELVTQGMPCYYRLANGNGAGAPKAMKADMLLLSGDIDLSEQLCYEAVCEGDAFKQDSICFCAELTLSRIFLLQGNREALFHSRERIARRAYEGIEKRCVYTYQLCRSFLDILLDVYDEIPAWLYDIGSIRRESLAVAVPFVQIINGRLLWHKLINHKISSSSFQRNIMEMIQQGKNFHLLLPVVYGLIYLAIAKEAAGEHVQARQLIKEAIDLASPDQVYLPFAENYHYIGTILDSLITSRAGKEDIQRIIKLGIQLENGVMRIKGENEAETAIILSRREKEIARLLQQRLSVAEISEKLYISPSTVRNTMQKLYDKLGIHKKSELQNKKWI